MTDLVTGDTGSKLRVTLTDVATSAVIDVTDATVNLRWEGDSGVVTRVMTKVDAANGVVEYQFAANEIIYPRMNFEVEIVDIGGDIISSLDLITLTVREQIG